MTDEVALAWVTGEGGEGAVVCFSKPLCGVSHPISRVIDAQL